MLRKIISNNLARKNVAIVYSDVLRRHRRLQMDLRSQQSCCVHNDLKDGYTLRDFMKSSATGSPKSHENHTTEEIPYIDSTTLNGDGRKVYFEIYGCQMNMNDTEVAWAILQGAGYEKTADLHDADVVLLVTCAIREGAESKIWKRLYELAKLRKKRVLSETKLRPKVGLLGCMAERLKRQVLEKERNVDLIAGPDSYKDLPRLLALTRSYNKAVNVLLSADETYADVMPVRFDENAVTAYVSIMRGCNNMCTYCIVPFTRGRERSRGIDSILEEVKHLSMNGFKEVTLLGQNVNSYRDISRNESGEVQMTKGFKTVYKLPKGGIPFAELLNRVADIDPEMRIRFTSPHPKDFPDGVLEAIRSRPNICKHIHLPAQSGNSEVLERMRRGYTREAYLDLVQRIREFIPEMSFSTDLILGFCGENEEQFRDTMSLVEQVRYSQAYVYAYSMRQKTTAHRRYVDDVPNDIKLKRVAAVLALFRNLADKLNKEQVGECQLVLIEGNPRRSDQQWYGRNNGNLKVVIPKTTIPSHESSSHLSDIKPGDYVCVKINEANSQTLKGTPLYHTTLQEFYKSEFKTRDKIAV